VYRIGRPRASTPNKCNRSHSSGDEHSQSDRTESHKIGGAHLHHGYEHTATRCRFDQDLQLRDDLISALPVGCYDPCMARNSWSLIVIVSIGGIAMGAHAGDDQNAKYTVRPLALPDHGHGNITMDYIAYDPNTGYVWVPAINIGSVDVVDTSNNSVREISGFATNEVEVRGRKRAQGPSGVSIGNGLVYIGDRADSSICAINERTLARKTCGHIDSTPDGVVYVAPTKEVWVTAPRDNSVRILDSQTLRQKEKLTFEGRPEGYAVDTHRGRFYMNYEDKDLTSAIDLKTHKTVAKWQSSCGEDGPHGLSVDQDAGYLFVACSTRAEVLDAGHNGEKLSSIDTGDGVDDLNYSPATHILYVGAAKDARLTVARVNAAGRLSLVAQVPTHEGARNGVVTKDGTVYLAHSQLGQLAGLIVVLPRGK
jgi:DNA-binding beta-propeller fold protein YncE